MRRHDRGAKEYAKYLVKFLQTKEGSQFAVHILSQLIEGFEVKHNGKIENVHIDDTKPIVLDFE